MSSNWTPADLGVSDALKTPYIWLDSSSSNLSYNDSNYVSCLQDKFGSGNDFNSIQNFNTIYRALPTRSTSRAINGLSTTTFSMDKTNEAVGLTQVNTINLSSAGTRGKMVLVVRQGQYPGTLFGINSSSASPWQYTRTGSGSGGASVGHFANIVTAATLFTSSSPVANDLNQLFVPPANTVYMLSISNVNSNHNFNGFGFNCETAFADGGGGPSNLNGWSGDFGELIVWQESTSANNTVQQLVEGYMAWKWGGINLGGGHPYEGGAPTYSTLLPGPFGAYHSNVTKVLWLDSSDPLYSTTNFVLKIADKSGYGNDLNTRPECKSNPVWPIRGALMNGLITTRFTQYAGISQPTSIENLRTIFVVGTQLASPSNGTWTQNLFGHDRYNDFSSGGITSNQFLSNADFPSSELYCVSGGVIVNNLTFPPVNSPFIFVQTISQSSDTSNIAARFQGLCYDCSNADSGWMGDIGEVVLFKKTALSLNQKNIMIMFLAYKWGLVLDDANSVFPNVKPFSTFSPKDFKPVAWYDSSDSQVNATMTRFNVLNNNTTNISYMSNSTVLQGNPAFSVQLAPVAGKVGNFSGLSGSPTVERPINGLQTIYIDNQSSLTWTDYSKFGYPRTNPAVESTGKAITNIFFVGRHGQYANSIEPWNSKRNYEIGTGVTGRHYVTRNGNIYKSKLTGQNLNHDPAASSSHWVQVTPGTQLEKYESIFGNLGYNAEPVLNDTANNPMLGGFVVPYQQIETSSSSTVATLASNANLSKNEVNSTIFAPSNAYNSNLMTSTAACYSLNQFGTSRYQVTTAATRFVKAQAVTAQSVMFPAPASTFLFSINGIQANGAQNTTFRGLFYDNMSYNNGWQGDFAEIITFTHPLSPQDILLVEGYLATKWGLQAALPVTHPFFFSGTTEIATCLTGYSPLTFGNIGADVTSSSDKLSLSGLPINITLPKNFYTTASFLYALNNNSKLTTGLTSTNKGLSVRLGGPTFEQLTWINTSETTFFVSANVQAALVFGFESAPATFAIPPTTGSILSPYFSYMEESVNQGFISQLVGTLIFTVNRIDTGESYIFNIDMKSFPSGVYVDGDSFAVYLQQFIQTKTGVPLQISFNSTTSKLLWALDPVFQSKFYLLGATTLQTSNVNLCTYLGLLETTLDLSLDNRLFLNSSSFSSLPSVGDPTFGIELGTFNVVSGINNYLYVGPDGTDPVVLAENLYTSPESFLEQFNYALCNAATGIDYPTSVTFMHQPYDTWGINGEWGVYELGPGYYPVYSYSNTSSTSIKLQCESTAAATLFGLAGYTPDFLNNVPGYFVDSFNAIGTIDYPYVEVSSGEYLTISRNSVDYTATLIEGKFTLEIFQLLLQEYVRAPFLPLGTPSIIVDQTLWEHVPSPATIARFNGFLGALSPDLRVSNDNNILEWNNTGSKAIVIKPRYVVDASILGLQQHGFNNSIMYQEGDPFVVYPNSMIKTDQFGPAYPKLESTLDFSTPLQTLNSNLVVLNSNVNYQVTKITKFNTVISSNNYLLNSGSYGYCTQTELVNSNATTLGLSIDADSYLWWHNNSSSRYTQTIIVHDILCSSLLGLFTALNVLDSNTGNAYITLNKYFLGAAVVPVAPPSPTTCSVVVTRANASPATITFSTSLSGSFLTAMNSALTAGLGANVLILSIVPTGPLTSASRFGFTNASKYDLTVTADATAQALFGMTTSSWVVTTGYTRSHSSLQKTSVRVLTNAYTMTSMVIHVNGILVNFGSISTLGNPIVVLEFIDYLNAGFAANSDPFVKYVSVSLLAGNKLRWKNAGPKDAVITLNYGAQSLLGASSSSFTIRKRPGNFSPYAMQTEYMLAYVNVKIYGLVSPQPLPEVSVSPVDLGNNNFGTLEWKNNSSYEIVITPVANNHASALLGLCDIGFNETLTLPALGVTAPHTFFLEPLSAASQSISIYGGNPQSSIVTLVDGKYNGTSLAAMMDKALLQATTLSFLTVKYGNRSIHLTFVNTSPASLYLSGQLAVSKMLGFVSSSTSTPGITYIEIPGNSSFECPYPLSEIVALSICKWDGETACPSSYPYDVGELSGDSNELALPFAKRCGKPFSQLLPQILTNAGTSNQAYSCPIGTELIKSSQNADPDYPVCSYVCEPPYYDSGTTCGYYPVYSPRDEKTLNILQDNAGVNIVEVTPTSTNSTTSGVQFLLFAVLASFALGLLIKTLPMVTANPSEESAAGSVLESVINKKIKMSGAKYK